MYNFTILAISYSRTRTLQVCRMREISYEHISCTCETSVVCYDCTRMCTNARVLVFDSRSKMSIMLAHCGGLVCVICYAKVRNIILYFGFPCKNILYFCTALYFGFIILLSFRHYAISHYIPCPRYVFLHDFLNKFSIVCFVSVL